MRTPLVSAIAFALAGLSAVVAAAPAADTSHLATTQLPRSVRPSHYDVAVVPHADKLAFDGKVAITVDVLEPTTSITLNAVDMAFANVTLAPVKGKVTFAAPKVSLDADAQTATFTFDHAVPAGSYTLSMDYTGKIGTQPNGLFAIDYDTRTSGKKRALYTQFENSDARRFIPSWDEPAYKATFTLTATVPSADMAVNNMPVATSKDVGNGLKTVTFAQTPKMSTYLLFFGVGEFDRATTMSDGVEIGVITQKGLTSQAKFTLDSGRDVLKEYNAYFGVPYPLPKLDNIASPGQSQFFAAMENWGAIYTFEYALLLDPSISTQADKQEVFNTAAHEMAHQWFGDLVTMRWWDDLWLNEGFASWLASRTTERLHPEWHTNLEAVSIREQAMTRDAGFNVKIQSTEFATSLNMADKGDFEAYVLAWSGRADPDGNLYSFDACKQPLNYAGYCVPEIDELLNKSRTLRDPAERKKVYEQIAARVLKDRPIIYLYHRNWLWAYTAKLGGVRNVPDGLLRVQGLKIN